MKKLIFMVIACLGICFAACKPNFKSQKFQVTDNLQSYTELNEAGDTCMGVKKMDGSMVIAPIANVVFAADRNHNVLIATNKKGEKFYYKTDGKPISPDPLSDFKIIGNAYKWTTTAGTHLLYFGDEIVETPKVLLDPKGYIGFPTDAGVRFVSVQGSSTDWTIEKDKAFFFVYGKTTNNVVIPEKKNAVVYDPSGKELKKLPLVKTQTLKKAKDKEKFGDNGTICKIETDL